MNIAQDLQTISTHRVGVMPLRTILARYEGTPHFSAIAQRVMEIVPGLHGRDDGLARETVLSLIRKSAGDPALQDEIIGRAAEWVTDPEWRKIEKRHAEGGWLAAADLDIPVKKKVLMALIGAMGKMGNPHWALQTYRETCRTPVYKDFIIDQATNALPRLAAHNPEGAGRVAHYLLTETKDINRSYALIRVGIEILPKVYGRPSFEFMVIAMLDSCRNDGILGTGIITATLDAAPIIDDAQLLRRLSMGVRTWPELQRRLRKNCIAALPRISANALGVRSIVTELLRETNYNIERIGPDGLDFGEFAIVPLYQPQERHVVVVFNAAAPYFVFNRQCLGTSEVFLEAAKRTFPNAGDERRATARRIAGAAQRERPDLNVSRILAGEQKPRQYTYND